MLWCVTPQSDGCLRCIRVDEGGSANTVSAGCFFDHFLILDLWRAFFKDHGMVGSCKPAIRGPLLPSQMARSWPVFIPCSCSGNGWRSPAAGYNYLQRQHSVLTTLQRATIRGHCPPPAKRLESCGHHMTLPRIIQICQSTHQSLPFSFKRSLGRSCLP